MGEGMSGPGSAECSGPRRKKGKEMVTTMVKTMTTTMKMPQAAVLVLRLKQWRSSASATGRVTGRILGDVLPVLRRAPEVFDDGNASAFANKVVQTWMAFARCLEGAKTPLVPTVSLLLPPLPFLLHLAVVLASDLALFLADREHAPRRLLYPGDPTAREGGDGTAPAPRWGERQGVGPEGCHGSRGGSLLADHRYVQGKGLRLQGSREEEEKVGSPRMEVSRRRRPFPYLSSSKVFLSSRRVKEN